MPGKKSKPKHSRLIIPDVDEITLPEAMPQPDRLGRVSHKKEKTPAFRKAKGPNAPPAPPTPEEAPAAEEAPSNVVHMPTTKSGKRQALRSNPKIFAIRRKKLRRKLIPVFFLVFVAILGFVYLSGIYLPAWTWASETITDLRISAEPGGGFPMEITLPEYIEYGEMGSMGAALLGAKDLVVISSTGAELQRIQHGYVNPCITTGNRRVCVYGRGSSEYTLLGRDKVLEKRSLGEEILFAEMSPGGYLAVFTVSRYQVTLSIYSPILGESEPIMQWPFLSAEESPMALAFAGDDRTFAVGTVATRGGVLGTTLYIAETGRDTVKATIQADNVIPLHIEFLSSGSLLVVYDRMAAIYSATGEELYSYSFENRSLSAMDCAFGQIALVFGSNAQEAVSLVILDERLAPIASLETLSVTTPKVLVASSGVYLLCDYELTTYNQQGQPTGLYYFDERPIALLRSGQELALTQGGLDPLSPLAALEESPAPAV